MSSSFSFNKSGGVNVNTGTNANANGVAQGQAAYQSGGNTLAYRQGSGGSFTYSGGGASGGFTPSGGATATYAADTVNGQGYGGGQDYSEAMDAIKSKQVKRNNMKRTERGESPSSYTPKSSGLNVAERAKKEAEAAKKQADRQQERDAATASVPKADTDETITVVAGAEEPLDEQPRTLSENTGYLDPYTGVITETSIDGRSYTPARRKPEGRKPGKSKAVKVQPSPMARAMAEIDREADDGRKTRHVRPSDLEASIDDAISSGVLDDMARTRRENQSLQEILDNWRPDTLAERVLHSRQKAEGNRRLADALRYAGDERDGIVSESTTINGEFEGDEVFDEFHDVGKAKTQREMLDALIEQENERTKRSFKYTREVNEDDLPKGEGSGKRLEHHPWQEAEDKILRKFAKARDEIKRRLINPTMLRIESQHVEVEFERHGDEVIRKGRIRYSTPVEHAIDNIRVLYNCSQRDVLSLVQIRAGLGVDIKGKIGKKKPGKFMLTDAQFIELCHDIERSQLQYGHPMAVVDGVPNGNGVRDDSGKFVVVAGTRCFPIGYVPVSLLRNMSVMRGSALYGQSIGDIQAKMRESWLTYTYPALMRNATGNVMWQTRAIENMVRAVMSVDGIDPSRLEIPEIKINQTMMQMEAERAQANDPAMKRSMEERARRESESCDRWQHWYTKHNGGRNDDGSIRSPSRKRNSAGDVLHGVTQFSQIARAADVFLWITSPFEAMQSMATQHVAQHIMERTLDKDVRERYKVTDRLADVATSREAVEARDVAESLFRLGGWTAIDAFLGTTGTNGRAEYAMTYDDLRRFLKDTGVTGTSLSERAKSLFKVGPNQERGFLANVGNILMTLPENVLTGSSNMFKEKESGQFLQLSLLEMARAEKAGRQAFTAEDMEQWAAMGGGQDVIRQLLRTDAGREAFMTQGVTGNGRKSPWSHFVRQALSKNRVTEAVVRTCIDRFPEYWMTKILNQIPGSNTMSYLATYAVDGLGSFLEKAGTSDLVMTGGSGTVTKMSEALGRANQYQMGRGYGSGRDAFLEGLRKNLLYDTVMAGNRLVIACLYYSILQLLGGLHKPDDPEDEYTWSEWLIGDEEDSLPIRWAWFMDDLSGVGLPLGAAFAAAASESGSDNPLEWTPEAKATATRLFMNAVGDFNDGCVIFDVIDLFNNFEEEANAAIGQGETGAWLNPSQTERNDTTIALMAWKILGDMTPTIVKQVLPWSRDFLFRGEDRYKRSASKLFDTDGRTMQEAQEQYRTKDVGTYYDYMMRLEAQNNPIAAAIMDFIWGAGGSSEKTGYKFSEQPIRTEVDQLAKFMWERYQMPELTGGEDEMMRQSRAWAEYICQEIDANFLNPTDAIAKGFYLDPKTRVACQEYCNFMMYEKIDEMRDDALAELREQMGMRYLPDTIYDNLMQTYDDLEAHYRFLNNQYFSNDAIPWRLPRYGVLDSDNQNRYVLDDGSAGVNPKITFLSGITQALGLGDLPAGEKQTYSYGNIPNNFPFYSPEPTGGWNDESLPYLVRRDKNGNPIGGQQDLYDMLDGGMTITRPPGMSDEAFMRYQNETNQRLGDLQSQMFGDRGRESIPTLGKRGLEPVEATMPEGFKGYYDPEQASEMLGFDAFDKSKKPTSTSKSGTGGSYGGYSSYGRSYGRSYGSSYGGGGGYSSAYNPKIYSSSRQVYSSRAAGMSTRQPYKASTTYLRPSFSTKGSREAYKRSDL